jgi:primosomal protein N' (replication factor Y)
MDADTTIGKKSHDDLINDFNSRKADILVGTQMVTKGLDFENVTLVGVLNADLTLYSDNFRSSEVTFSQITQVIGRAGRRNVQGRAIIQTLTPDSRVLEFCKTADYEGFYNYEIGMRKLLIYPPFCDLATLTISSIYRHCR